MEWGDIWERNNGKLEATKVFLFDTKLQVEAVGESFIKKPSKYWRSSQAR